MDDEAMTTLYQEATRRQREIAFAAATDAGNRSMRRNGRRTWAQADWEAACEELTRLLPDEPAMQVKGTI